MSDLIRRDEVLETYADIYFDLEQFLPNIKKELDKIYDALQAIPTAEPKAGKWEECKVVDIEDTTITEVQSAYCSVCHKYHTTPYMYYFDYFNYCPNCGAKMERSE